MAFFVVVLEEPRERGNPGFRKITYEPCLYSMDGEVKDTRVPPLSSCIRLSRADLEVHRRPG